MEEIVYKIFDFGFRNESSFLYTFDSEVTYLVDFIQEHFNISDSDDIVLLHSHDVVRIIACDDDTFLILKTLIEIHK